jgi:hypothetical protein
MQQDDVPGLDLLALPSQRPRDRPSSCRAPARSISNARPTIGFCAQSWMPRSLVPVTRASAGTAL